MDRNAIGADEWRKREHRTSDKPSGQSQARADALFGWRAHTVFRATRSSAPMNTMRLATETPAATQAR